MSTESNVNSSTDTHCSLVIRCYNEEKHIGRLLAGIEEQTVKNIEIILVDSGSTDATLSIASRYPVKTVSIDPEEFSFGKSLNAGCAEASGEYIVLASAHIYPLYKDWIEKMLEPFRDEDVALVYGKQRGDKYARYSENQIYNKWYPEHSINHQEHPFCNNANAAIRRAIWHDEPYNEELTGLEDLEWAKRMIENGKKIVYASEAEIIHVHDETPSRIYNRYKREAVAFKRIYPNERFHVWDFARLFSANVVTDFFHARQDGVLLRNFFSIPLFRFLQFWGTYMGYQEQGSVTHNLRNRFYYPNGFFGRKTVVNEKNKDRLIDYEHH